MSSTINESLAASEGSEHAEDHEQSLGAAGSASRGDNGARPSPDRTAARDFSWYGGTVDRVVVREIVRLKRESKI
jgi:hypothetical protein